MGFWDNWRRGRYENEKDRKARAEGLAGEVIGYLSLLLRNKSYVYINRRDFHDSFPDFCNDITAHGHVYLAGFVLVKNFNGEILVKRREVNPYDTPKSFVL